MGLLFYLQVIAVRGSVRFRCTICGSHYGHRTSLIVHQRRHEGKYSYYCPKCGKGCASTSFLRRHLSSAHQANTKFECVTCGQSFDKMKELTLHTMISGHVDPYKKNDWSSIDDVESPAIWMLLWMTLGGCSVCFEYMRQCWTYNHRSGFSVETSILVQILNWLCFPTAGVYIVFFHIPGISNEDVGKSGDDDDDDDDEI